MGTNTAPHTANIYLHVYEYNYILQLIEKRDRAALKNFSIFFGFQDDLLAINDLDSFRTVLDDYYPRKMQTNFVDISPCDMKVVI